MDGIEGLLARDFGVRPQGKAAPMAAARGGGSAWPNPRSTPAPSYDGLFGAPGPAPSASSPSLDSIFDSFKGPSSSSTSTSAAAAAGTKPAFDDDFFNPVSGLGASNSTSSTARYDAEDVFGTGAAPAYDDVFTTSNRSAPPSYDDFLGGFSEKPRAEETKRTVVVEDDDLLGGFGMKPAGEKKKKPVKEEEDHQGNGFDDLIPGFPGSSPPKSRNTDDDKIKKPSVSTSKSTASMVDDPFVVLEGVSALGSASPSSGRFTDPLEDLDKSVNTEGKNFDSTADDSLFEDSSAFDHVPKSDPSFTSETNGDTNDSHLHSKARDSRPVQSSVKRNPVSRSSLEDFENGIQKSQSAGYSDIHVDDSSERYSGNGMDDQSPISTESEDDIWLTVSEIPLFTRPTIAPPPSRSPPLLKQKSRAAKANGKHDKYVQQSSQQRNHQKYSPEQADVSSIDESDGVSLGKPQRPAYYDTNAFDEDEEYDTNSSAREERESQERLEQAQERLREEQRRREKERELEQEREKQAVERATKEARERAAAEARAKAERDARQRSQRAAVQRANQEARVRAAAEAKDRVARAAAEERERAAAEAKEKERAASRERAAAEAKERERTAARERATAERAATERAQQEARKRAERAAAERAAAEARERHAAAAAASAAKEKQSTPDDLDSFFKMDPRDNSASKQRTPTVESMFDPQPQGRGTVNGSQRPGSTSASTRKANAPSAANIFGNGLSDLFEFEPRSSSDVFQDVEGESEERRRARLERHQRTRERAAKALAEKNERDMQVQREQAERDRIGDSLDFEIKRWAAGKEGNLRALLSTLQYILWPECGWQAVSLTDLITGAAVKKQYRRATLCIHPDKVQQKGATLQQKYIAEKVFDMLKEAWNKFNSEELF
uniref:Uncharacterized protein n=1 Tax=Avena sativa TaxID=4498 RepID=A0ACD5W802_AVESA